MRRKWKIGLVLAVAVVAVGAVWLWPSQEPAYEGKRLRRWLDEGLTLGSITVGSTRTEDSHKRVIRAVQTIGTNAIPFLVRDMERSEPRWLGSVKDRACRWRLMDQTHLRDWRLMRSAWGFRALGTNAAPAVEKLLALRDSAGDLTAERSAVLSALSALGPFAVPGLVARLRSTNSVIRERAADTLAYMGGPAAESAVPSIVAMLGDTNLIVRRTAIMSLVKLDPIHPRLVPLLRGLLADPNEQLRAYAAASLGRIGLPARAAIPDLVQATNDPSSAVVESARRAVARIESEVVREALR